MSLVPAGASLSRPLKCRIGVIGRLCATLPEVTVMTQPQQDAVASYRRECLPRRSTHQEKSSWNSIFVDSGGCVAFSTPPTLQDGVRTADVTHAAVLSQRRCCQINLIPHVAVKPASRCRLSHPRSRLSRDAGSAAPVSSLRWIHTLQPRRDKDGVTSRRSALSVACDSPPPPHPPTHPLFAGVTTRPRSSCCSLFCFVGNDSSG